MLIHGDIIERIPTITSTDGLEYKLTTAIQKLNQKVSALLALQGKINVKDEIGLFGPNNEVVQIEENGDVIAHRSGFTAAYRRRNLTNFLSLFYPIQGMPQRHN